ncbi:MAG: outer membrane protein [bacterium]
MKKKAKLNPAVFAAAIIAVAFLFSLAAVHVGKAYADGPYFNDFYVSLNGGAVQTSPSGLSSTSGGTVNLSLGKNYNLGGLVIGGVVNGGYASNGSYTYSNFDGYGDNETASVYSVYYSAAVKAGYAINNFMPFVKLGYIGYSYTETYSYSGPYENYYLSSIAPVSSEGGLMYGAGVEYLFNRTWGVTAQYFGASLSGGDRTNNYTIGIDFNF